MTRSQAREQAFALLFEKTFHPETELDDIITLGLANHSLQDDAFTMQLVGATWSNLFEIDNLLERHAMRWKKNRISKVSLSVLRLSICELLYIKEVPPGVSINEAVELCKKYASAEDAAFVNGILGTVARELAPQDMPPDGAEQADATE